LPVDFLSIKIIQIISNFSLKTIDRIDRLGLAKC
jgi:hypothetical protein